MKTNFTEKWICVQIVMKINPENLYDERVQVLKEWRYPLQIVVKHRNFFRVYLAHMIVKRPNDQVEIRTVTFDPYTNELWSSDRRKRLRDAYLKFQRTNEKLFDAREEFNVSLFKNNVNVIDEKSEALKLVLERNRETIDYLENLPITEKI